MTSSQTAWIKSSRVCLLKTLTMDKNFYQGQSICFHTRDLQHNFIIDEEQLQYALHNLILRKGIGQGLKHSDWQ